MLQTLALSRINYFLLKVIATIAVVLTINSIAISIKKMTESGGVGLGKRSITDAEIGLIKAMLLRRMKNKDIQFYFNRQDRAVNSGRITQIRDETYGPEVPTASEQELNNFLSAFKPAEIGAVVGVAEVFQREPSLVERAAALFVKGRTGWLLTSHETDRVECKETFCLKPEARFADPLRSIAGLANNGGGFIFLASQNYLMVPCKPLDLKRIHFSLQTQQK